MISSSRLRVVVLAALCAALLAAADLRGGKLDPRIAKFSVRVGDDTFPYDVMSLFVLPREEVVFELPQPPHAEYDWHPEDNLARLGPDRWKWRAPGEPGLYRLKISNTALRDSISVRVFVMVPANRIRGEWLNGYRIGRYPARPLQNNPIYRPPQGFIEVTRDNRDTHVSPHFKLEQFLCKQPSGYPIYLVLEERLLLALERLLQEVNARGFECDTFQVMSGYRTPFYNKAIGDVAYSMHQWGSAADVFIDRDENGVIDDLNRDRQIDYRDAAVLRDIADRMQRIRGPGSFPGGLGLYTSTPAHGPFVHIDVRGRLARWEHLGRPEPALRALTH